MHDGNDEQLLCLLTFMYLAFILEFFQELLKTEIIIYGKHKTKSLGKRKAWYKVWATVYLVPTTLSSGDLF